MSAPVRRSGCRTRSPSRSATIFAGGAVTRAPTTGARVGPREQERELVARCRGARGRPRRTARSPRRRCGASDSPRGSAAAAARRAPPCAPRRSSGRGSACRRDGRVSCCTTRAGCPSSSSRNSSPSGSCPASVSAQVALDRHRHALHRQAALVVGLELVAQLGQDRVHDGDDVVLAALEDEDALEDADLCRCEADAARVVHQHAACA